MSAFRLGRPKPKPKIMLERAKTVASGLGQNPKNEIATVAEAEDFGISRANSPKDEAFHTFCRGSLKRLKKAESKVSVAKRDMEEILEQAKSDSDTHLNALRGGDDVALLAVDRLAQDSRLAIEAQQEMRRIVCQFANLLQEEEDRVAVQAEILQRRSSQVHFDFALIQRRGQAPEGDGHEDDQDHDDESQEN